MTREEKQDILRGYCLKHKCINCPLNVGGWENQSRYYKCVDINLATDNDLDRALLLIGEVKEDDYTPIIEKIKRTITKAVEKEFENLIHNSGDKNNPYWERITAIANRQREKGISEYGQGIECDNADIMTRLDRIEEELIDALMYLEHLRDGIKEVKND